MLIMNAKRLLNATTPQRLIITLRHALNLDLQPQTIFSVDDVANIRIACIEGSIWITLDDDKRDIVLEGSGVFMTQDHRRAVIYAIKPSLVSVATIQSSVLNALTHDCAE
jgi:Protein of unknown function (DUF2917)